MLALVKSIFACPPPRNYTLKFDHVLSPPYNEMGSPPLAISGSNAVQHLSNSASILSRSPSCLSCVCAENKSSVHTQPWLCKWETNKVALTEPPNTISNRGCSC